MPKKILIIEDDEFIRELVKRKLRKEDFEILEVVEGEKGITKIKEEKPDLILLDIILPGIDGFEVLTQIKQDPATSQIPVIILSNLGEKKEIEKGLKLGAADYLVKAHFTIAEVLQKIKTTLKH